MPRACVAVCLLVSLFHSAAHAQEQGQYRSKIRLDPLGEMGAGSEMSAAELEKQIDSIDDPYAKASAGRFLARHHVQSGDYASAIAYYEQALASGGLSPVANREMLRELAQVHMLDENYEKAAVSLQRALDIDLVPQSQDFLLLAQARHRLADYVGVVAALDGIAAAGLVLDDAQLRQALALYYRAGAFEQCEDILAQLLKIEPGNPDHWHQLAGVYLQQNKRREALDHLVLARQKKVAFNASELTLLVDLLALNGNPYGAAETLEQAMAQGELAADAANQRKLFELWLQARERDRAMKALAGAAGASGDPELYLYLAQLQMEDEKWTAMQEAVLSACQEQLEDRYVSRANLLLGISLLKQQRDSEARRALINATLVGGANAQAADWLKFMQAEPATEAELRRVRGPCYGSEGKRAELSAVQAAPDTAVGEPSEAAKALPEQRWLDIEVKTVPATRFFYSEQSEGLVELLPKIRDLAPRLNVNLQKAGGTANGPVHLLGLPGEKVRLAQPLRGNAQTRGRYRIYASEAFNCASIVLELPVDDPADVLTQFHDGLEELGHSPTGEYRLVLPVGGASSAELQLGIE